MPKLLDQFGRPIDLSALKREESAPSLMGIRNILSDHPSRGLTPQRLTAILLEAEDGDATRYYELAEDMEERDLNLLAQLGTRKRAIAQLEITVEAASDSAEDVGDADLIREFLRRDDLEEVLFDVLDAIGKGISVCEILWDMSERQWMPRDLVWRDPRWFTFDRSDGTTLLLRDGAEMRPLTPYKYITHVVKAKSGVPIRGGLARSLSWIWLFKNYTVKDWMAFAEVYGQPYRVGVYPASATSDEKAKLLQAVASIGSDAAAIIPEGMKLDFVESSGVGVRTDLYQQLATYLDAQATKAILGQTLTSDVGSGGGSRALGEVHNEVRGDIRRADARQLAATLNRCLVRPLVDLNRGPRKAYPRILIGLPDELSTTEKIDALTKLVPLGMKVEISQVRDQLGYAEPDPDAELLQASPPALAAPAEDAPAKRPIRSLASAAHAVEAPEADAIDQLVEDAIGDSGWEPVMRTVVDPLQELLDQVGTLEELRDRLPELLERDASKLQEILARTFFGARLAGALGVPVSPGEDPANG